MDHRGYSRNSLLDETDVTFIRCYLIKTLYSDSTTQHNRHVPLDRYYLVIDNRDTSRTTFHPNPPQSPPNPNTPPSRRFAKATENPRPRPAANLLPLITLGIPMCVWYSCASCRYMCACAGFSWFVVCELTCHRKSR